MIVLLNGVGSVGKSSIARALLALTRTPFLHVAMDDFIDMLPANRADDADAFAFQVLEDKGAPEVSISAGPVEERQVQAPGHRGSDP